MKSAKRQDRVVWRRPSHLQFTSTLKKMGLGVLLVLVLTGVFYTRADIHTRVFAATSSNLNFQARLSSSNGQIVPDGNYHVEFKVYRSVGSGQSSPGVCNGPSGSPADDCLWKETRTTGNLVRIVNGYLTVNLGSVTAFPSTIDWSQEQWLSMNIGGSGGSASWDGEMNPRLKLTAVPYAFRAGQADTLTNGSGTISASNLIQAVPVSLQEFNATVAAIRLNQTGSGGLLQLQGDGTDVFTLSKTGALMASGTITFPNLVSCDTIDTNASGLLTCGTDNSGIVTSVTLQTSYNNSTSPEITLDNVRGALTIRDSSTPLGANLLEIQSNNGLTTYFAVTANGAVVSRLGTTDATNLQLVTNDTQALLVDTSGNVRIGSGSPTEKLDVGGAIRVGNTTNANSGTIRWNGADFQGYTGSGWVSMTGTGGGSLTINPTANKRKSADETQNLTANALASLQDDDQLFFAIGANETWSFRFVVAANAGTAPDIKFAVTAPSGASCNVGVTDSEGAVAVGNLGCGASSGLITGNGTEDIYEIVGTVANGATSGNVTLQWAQNSASSTNTIVRAGSYLTADRVTGGVQTADAFIQSGNSFGAAAVLGTNDNFGLSLLTNGSARLSILANGNVGIGEANPSALFSVGSGSPFQVNNIGVVTAAGLTSSGALTITAGGASITGGLNNNSGGITNAGNITGVGTNITASAGLTIASGGSASLILDSASNTLVMAASDTGLQRTAAGSYTIDLNDSAATSLVLNNTGSDVANLNLSDGGLQTAGTVRLTNGGALQNITGLTVSSGGASISGNITLGGATTDRLTVTSQLTGQDALVFQGATDNSFTTTLRVIDPTANNILTLPNGTGTLVLDSRSILAGTGLTGGGNLSTDRTLNLDINGLTSTNAVNPTDYIAIYEGSTIKKISRTDFLQGLIGALQYRGTWDASTNTPALSDATGTQGDEYAVAVAGTQNLGSGNITFGVGDFVIHNGTRWQLAPSSSQVSSVFGRTGAVVSANGDYTASQITNVATGGIAAVTLQAAINELDSEKLGSLNGLTANSQTFANDTNVTISSSSSTHTLGWAGQLSVGRGGTGASSFTQNGILYGNNTSALQVTAAGTGGQVLLANSSGVPVFTSLSGDITIDSSGVTTIGANKVALGTDTAGDYIQNLGTLTGLTATGNSGEGSTPALAVNYGSLANTAVQGNTTLICPSGSGNLSGGGNTITLGTGGTCNSLSTAASVTFSTSVTTPILSSSGGLTISSDASGDINIDSGTGLLIIDDSDTTLQRIAAGTYTIDLKDASTTTLSITNSGAGLAGLSVEGTVTFSSLVNCNTIDTNASGVLSCGSDEGGVGGSSTLQASYAASTNPEITLDSTRGALTIRDQAVTPLNANLLEIQSNNGDTTYFAVTDDGASVTGTLVSSSTLTVSANGAVISGGIDNNSGGITETGSITGVGTNITASAALTVASGGSGALTLDSASGTLILAADDTILQRTASGTYTIDLNDAANTTLALTNSGSGLAHLTIDGNLGISTFVTADSANTILKVGTTGNATMSGATLLNTIAEFTTALRIGDGTNGIEFSASAAPIFRGTARPTKRLAMSPEFPGVMIRPDGSNNIGTMSSFYDSSNFKSYYQWTTTQTTNQDYDIVVRVPIPMDYSALPASPEICFQTYTSDTTNGILTLSMNDSDNAAVTLSSSSFTPASASTNSEVCRTINGSPTLTAGGYLTLRMTMRSPQNGTVRLGEFRMDYLSKF